MNPAKHLMRTHGLVMLLCIAGGVTACAPVAEQPAPEPAPTTEADVAAINRVHDEYTNALNAGDAAAYVALLTEDAVVMPPNQPAAIGQEASRARIQRLFDQNTLEIARSVEEVVVAGDWAFSRHTGTGTQIPKAGGEPREFHNKGMAIFQRQPDGSWKITRYIFNSNTPPPGTSQ